ncbi:MAG: response regulator receiver protein [Deltaproteobacteria bacterium]|nr:response regulator receiver protein [Deltaproteobacteria bacterium]
MIAACPKCQTRYRVEPERLGADGARLRCSHCSAVFRVRLPAASHAEAVAPVEPTPRPEPSPANQGTPEASDLASEAAASGAVARSPQGAEGGASEGRPGPRSVEPPNLEAPHFDHSRLVLVAHPNPDACKRIAETLEREGLQVLVAHDGVEAILSIQRALPRAVVLDAALPKMFGFQVCELLKRNESLRVTNVCLLGAIHRDDRYRRSPNEIYGADFYIEGPSLLADLTEWLGRIGFELRTQRSTQIPAPAPERPPEATRSQGPSEAGDPAPPVSALGDVARGAEAEPSASSPHASKAQALRAAPGSPVTPAAGHPVARAVEPQPVPLGSIGVAAQPLAAARAQAERLARIIVSDIVLYNQEKFGAAVRSGGVLEAMRDELQEGRALFRERIDAQVRDERDFLADELLRVARGRGMP